MNFKRELKRLGLKQVDLMRLVQHLCGEPLHPVTMSRWASGEIETPAIVQAFLRLYELLAPETKEALLLQVKKARKKSTA